MSQSRSPAVLRRWIAFELRRLREAAGLSQTEAARGADCTQSRIAQVEGQRTLPRLELVRKLLRTYDESPRTEHFADLLEQARKKYWWEGLDEIREPSGFDLYLGLEDGAAQIESYDCQVLPGILQTPDYAREVIRQGTALDDEAVERRAQVRIARQELLTKEQHPLHYQVIIDEQVLHRPVGDPETMRHQFQHLVDQARLPTVQLQVLPVAVGVHRANAGAFTVMRFPMPEDPGLVYIETYTRAVWFEDQAEIDAYTQLMNHLREMALPQQDSLSLLQEKQKEINR